MRLWRNLLPSADSSRISHPEILWRNRGETQNLPRFLFLSRNTRNASLNARFVWCRETAEPTAETLSTRMTREDSNEHGSGLRDIVAGLHVIFSMSGTVTLLVMSASFFNPSFALSSHFDS
ncbi:hypothetical protein QQF64_005025, partial [Cirrhinus molitorella]